MDEFLLQNVDRYQLLLGRFRPEPERRDAAETVPNPDLTVNTRIRPLSEEDVSSGFPRGVFPRPGLPGKLDVHELKRPVRGLPTLKSANYRVDRVFDTTSTTEDIYKDIVEPLVPYAWGGGIGTLFAYGQTGSGKTYTVSRLERLVIEALMSGGLDGNRKIYLTIIELAGNSAHDLLNFRKPISVLEDSFGVTQLAGALEHHVTSLDEVMGYIESATSFRRTASTEKNDASSRSHAICRIRIQIPSLTEAEDGLLYLIDLAGSEAARDVATHGASRMRETREINTSLSILKDCIRGKAEADSLVGTVSKRKPHVPFRQSALTKVLKHVFDPEGTRTCKTAVMACINPSLADIPASRNTLRYAEMLRIMLPKIKAATFDPSVPTTWSNEQLRAWIDAQSGDPPVASEILAPQESGSQLIRLPAPEFELRCLKTEGVLPEQAKAFRSKLWQLHVDSQRAKATKSQSGGPSSLDDLMGFLQEMESRNSSRDPDSAAKSIPFKQRIRPGMAIRWAPPREYYMAGTGICIAVVLCPVSAAGGNAKDVNGEAVNPSGADSEAGQGTEGRYLCAMVTPAAFPEAYELNMWRHAVVHEDMMEAEVILEYDGATRYYYLAV